MKIIVCLDAANGMLFNHRRQSSDRLLRQNILQMLGESALYLNTYSAKQFTEGEKNLIIDKNFLARAGRGDYAFVENLPIASYLSKIEQIIVYRWNRSYPADFFLDVDLTSPAWKLLHSEEFAGYSHACIGKEIYEGVYV